MRSRAYSNTAQPKREVCPRCTKKGIGIWHGVKNWQGITDFQSRNCRYCNYTEFQNYVFDRHTYRGNWVTDTERMASYNGNAS